MAAAPLLVNRQEMVAVGRRPETASTAISHIAVGAVLEPPGKERARRHLPGLDRAIGGSAHDRRPRATGSAMY